MLPARRISKELGDTCKNTVCKVLLVTLKPSVVSNEEAAASGSMVKDDRKMNTRAIPTSVIGHLSYNLTTEQVRKGNTQREIAVRTLIW